MLESLRKLGFAPGMKNKIATVALTLLAFPAWASPPQPWWSIDQTTFKCIQLPFTPQQLLDMLRSRGDMTTVQMQKGFLGAPIAEIKDDPQSGAVPVYYEFFHAWGGCHAALQTQRQNGNAPNQADLQ